MPKGIFIRTPEIRKKISESEKGKKLSRETKKKISIGLKGRNIGEEHHAWKGEKVSYRDLHLWVERCKGKPNKCEDCGKESDKPKEMQWSNKDHKYRRVLKDYTRRCRKCHNKYDAENNLSRK